jgi:hypothetical protein
MQSRGVALVLIALGTAGFIACGSRTGLPFDETAEEADTSPDVRRLPDGAIIDSAEEELPMLDSSKREASRMDCQDAGDTQIYLVTDSNELVSFYPPTAFFKQIGVLACPARAGFAPFSMAVDRKGVAFVLFENPTRTDGDLFRVSTSNGACVSTSYVSGQHGFDSFGMGFATLVGGSAERLFIAQDTANGNPPALGYIDTTSFNLTRVGDFNPALSEAELTGTGDGRLFAFYRQTMGAPTSFVGEIDQTSANVIAADQVAVDQMNGWAFGFWGGDFYLFTGTGAAGSIVTRYRPSDKSLTVVGTYPALIVGAGVSTCAPQ